VEEAAISMMVLSKILRGMGWTLWFRAWSVV